MRSRFIATLIAVLASIPALAIAQQTAIARPDGKPVITEETPGLMAKAKISSATALTTARGVAPKGAVLSKGVLEEEDGKLIYSLVFKVAGQKTVKEINVDAVTGKVVAQEDEDGEAEEAGEKHDAKAPARKG